MLASSAIEPDVIRAYLETEYLVLGKSPFTLRIGQASAELLAFHRLHGAQCSSFLTAFNPFSQQVDDAVNASRQADLAKELKLRGLAFVEGVGQHPSGNWPGEESFLVLGLKLEAAKLLGRQLEQNALVWADDDAVPQLILLR